MAGNNDFRTDISPRWAIIRDEHHVDRVRWLLDRVTFPIGITPLASHYSPRTMEYIIQIMANKTSEYVALTVTNQDIYNGKFEAQLVLLASA